MLLCAIIAIICNEHTVVHNWMAISERSLRLLSTSPARAAGVEVDSILVEVPGSKIR